MASRKEIRSDNTYLISTDSTDNPKLGAKIMSNGKESLYLDYYLGYTMVYDEKKDKMVPRKERRRETLKLYLWQAPRTPEEREENKKTLELAKSIRFIRGQELLESTEGYKLKKDRKINFLDFYQAYIDKYTKKDIKMIKGSFKRFKDFLNDSPQYNKYAKYLKPEQIDKDMMIAFTEYLKSRSVGEGARSYYQRFKKVVYNAIEHDIIRKNPFKGVVLKVDENVLKKDVLSDDEIIRLANYNDEHINPNIKKAFIFCIYTGMRFCDVKDLTYKNIDYSNKLLRFEQVKTKGHSANSGVVIPLNEVHISLIGEPENGDKNNLIFPLPSYTICRKELSRWVSAAGIDKHITWHCARHSFAVNILNNGANIKTVATLLGHSGLKHTEKYTRAVDKLKSDAINSLPKLKLTN